jgi:hypothetical protein
MKLITIHFATVWLVLQAMPHFVRGDGLRRTSSSSVGVPADTMLSPSYNNLHENVDGGVDSANVSPLSVVETMEENAMGARSLQVCPTGSKTEVWFGYHTIQSNLNNFYQAKLWVISSDPTFHSNPAITWNVPTTTTPIPTAYKGNKLCAKFFTIGAMEGTGATSKKNLVGIVNSNSDITNPLSGALLVSSDYNPVTLKTQIDAANTIMINNFINTNLEYEVYPWDDWYKRGYGWNEFSPNGYISGILGYLFPTYKLPSLSSYLFGLKKPVPTTLFTTTFTAATEKELNQEVRKEVYKTVPCTAGKAELWVGRHRVNPNPTKIDWVDHAKLWVISSNATHHGQLGSIWKDLSLERVPDAYAGDKNCAKFFSVGAMSSNNELFAEVNLADDVTQELLGAYRISWSVDPLSFKTTVDSKNIVMNRNFINTALKHDTSFPRDTNNFGFGWNEFNSNGYISGLLKSMTYSVSSPVGGFLPGWTKQINEALFRVDYTTDDQVKQLLGVKGSVYQPSVLAGTLMQLSSMFDP